MPKSKKTMSENELNDKLVSIEDEIKNNKESKPSEWVKRNKTILTVSGKSISWIIENIEEIQQFIETVTAFRSPTFVKQLDLDKLMFFGNSFNQTFADDQELYSKIVLTLIDTKGFDEACSQELNLIIRQE